MTRAANLILRLSLLLALSAQAQQAVTQDPVQLAEEEAVRRQEATIELHMKLDQAVAAQKRGQLIEAAKFYQEAVVKGRDAQVGNAAVAMEKQQALMGLDAVREKLTRASMERGDMLAAAAQVDAALKMDPNNENLRKLRLEVEKRSMEQRGMVPSPDVVKRIPEIEQQKIDAGTKVQNAKLLYEMGKYDEAEAILVEVLKVDPANKPAPYYLDLVKEARFAANARRREALAKSSIANVEKLWIPAGKNELLPVPNPMAHTNLVYTSQGRQEILSKLERIRLNEVSYDLPLTEVLNRLRVESQKRDPDGVGINFMINPHADAAAAAISPTDTTGAAAAGAVGVAAPAPAVDFSTITIKITPPLNNLRLADVLDAITKVADQPIKYTIEDYAVVFSPKPAEPIALYTRVFKVDPNTFVQGLQNVSSINLNPGTQSAGTGGGGGGGGGGGSGGGGGQGGTSSTGVQIPSVQISAITQGGQQGGGITGGGGGNQVGLEYVTKTNTTVQADEMVRAYFTAAGVNLTDPGKVVFFNDRLGELMVRASLQDLEIIEEAIELLNQAPPELTIEAKFVELSQEDSRALGFNWYWGNTLVNNGAIGVQGGTAPAYQGNATAANPSGIFPGPGTANGNGTFTPGPGAAASSASDNVLTSGLRNIYTTGNSTGPIPTVATISGIMTDPQFRVAIQAIQQRTGSDLLSAPKITTLSGRQTHIAAQDLQYIVTSVQTQVTGTSSTGLVGGSGTGVAVPQVNYNTTPYGFGPVLDVMPTVSADGFSVQMVLIPTILEFIQYDSPGGFVPQAEAAAGGTIGIPVQAVLPLPHFRVREVVTTCNVWDGQTVVLGGMISETITKIKDQVPVLGDLPIFGRLFKSESTDSQKQNLLIFVTPTIIDPAGNRVHNDDDMPFAHTSVPPQPPVANP
jgi:type II secretory pathway component GspD/PulD (secretin)